LVRSANARIFRPEYVHQTDIAGEENFVSNAVDLAYGKIRAGILDGQLAPGSRLKEKELVEFCGVSRTPVRDALRRLAAEDFVSIQPNQGAQVRSWNKEDLDDLFALRALLEGYAARRAAKRITQEGLDRLEMVIGQMTEILAADLPQEEKISEFLRLNRAVHEPIWEASGSKRLISVLSNLVEQALVVHTVRYFTMDRIATSHRHHEDLLRALKAGDESWAESIMTNHIHAARREVQVELHTAQSAPATGPA
jgi:DNA-binding GntR family transcriptional regulator